MPDLVVAGAGMAGLAAAARARELGASVDLLEKGDRPGGSMLLSSGFFWRHRTFDDFRADIIRATTPVPEWPVRWDQTGNDSISPIAGACRKPCPEKPVAYTSPAGSGAAPTRAL